MEEGNNVILTPRPGLPGLNAKLPAILWVPNPLPYKAKRDFTTKLKEPVKGSFGRHYRGHPFMDVRVHFHGQDVVVVLVVNDTSDSTKEARRVRHSNPLLTPLEEQRAVSDRLFDVVPLDVAAPQTLHKLR